MQSPCRIWLRGNLFTEQIIHLRESEKHLNWLNYNLAKMTFICLTKNFIHITFMAGIGLASACIFCNEPASHICVREFQQSAVFRFCSGCTLQAQITRIALKCWDRLMTNGAGLRMMYHECQIYISTAPWGNTAWTPNTLLAICVIRRSTTKLASAFASARVI